MSAWTSFLSSLSAFRRWLSDLLFPSVPEESGEKRGARWARLGFRITLTFGFLSILLYAAEWDRFTFLKITSLALLYSLAALLVGVLLGFLFGIPRTLAQASPASPRDGETPGAAVEERDEEASTRPEYRGNTNLEQISDWLTKIIVGLTLVEFNAIKQFIRNLVDYLAKGFGVEISHQSFILSLLIFFPLCGFFIGYLLTRLYLPLALTKTDIESRRMKSLPKIESQVSELRSSSTRDLEVTPESRALLEGVRGQIQLLAREYENLRATMPSGNDRTRAMELVASQMRTLANMGQALIPYLRSSSSPGERLAAVVFLQVHPNQEYLDWLADRIASEKPFIGYHAAVALLYAARSLGRAALDAIQGAKRFIGPELVGSDRARILDQAERAALAG